jgi:hypothetical protein
MSKNYSRFSRSNVNDKKMGAYYTDPDNLIRIRNLLSFPEQEVCCLDPCSGDGNALDMVTAGVNDRKLFGIELNGNSYVYTKKVCDFSLNADFLHDVKITGNVFSFAFMNPPYLQNMSRSSEFAFLEKLTRYIANGGVVVLVVPEHSLDDMWLTGYIMSRYSTEHVYRFTESEYKKYKQYCFVLRKDENAKKQSREQITAKSVSWKNTKEVLPECIPDDQRTCINPSKESSIKTFESIVTSEHNIKEILDKSRLGNRLGFLSKTDNADSGILRPPLMPKKDHQMLLIAAGVGGGHIKGSDVPEHLIKGTVIRRKKVDYNKKKVGDRTVTEEVVTEYSKPVFNIVEAHGQITTLE